MINHNNISDKKRQNPKDDVENIVNQNKDAHKKGLDQEGKTCYKRCSKKRI